MSRTLLLPLILIFSALLAACQTPTLVAPAETPQPGGAPVATLESGAGDGLELTSDLRPIAVSQVGVEVGIGSPIPVHAVVSGEWPDLCAQLAEITQRFDDYTIRVTLLASAADPACPPDYLGLPFRIDLPINVVELPEGTYTVVVNGVSATFDVPVTPALAETPGDGLAHYQGPNPYGVGPSFDVGYDPAVWEYVEDDGSGRPSQLLHRELPGCVLWLRAGPVGMMTIASSSLAGLDWTIGLVQPYV